MANGLARRLRTNQTPSELKLWRSLRELRRKGYHVRRQVVIDGYIVDFACLSQRVLIEVDGSQHLEGEGVKRDVRRDAHLSWRGYTVLRFTNADVANNLNGVMESIVAALGAAPRIE